MIVAIMLVAALMGQNRFGMWINDNLCFDVAATDCVVPMGQAPLPADTTIMSTVWSYSGTTWSGNPWCYELGSFPMDSQAIAMQAGSCIMLTAVNPGSWTFCANEDGQCNVVGTKEVRYGADPTYFSQVFKDTVVACNNATFGDPLFGTVKHCDVRDVALVAPAAPTNLGVQ